jgi:hypothetical protein
MVIEEIVEQALEKGYLSSAMEAEFGRLCENKAALSSEEYQAMDRLMGALLTGQVVAASRKQFINIMEELVLTEVIIQVAALEAEGEDTVVGLGDIAAYALNRLPPLYATTEEGANYQRQRVQADPLRELIVQQVEAALSRYLEQPEFYPERRRLGKQEGGKIMEQLSALLQTYAPNIETPTHS